MWATPLGVALDLTASLLLQTGQWGVTLGVAKFSDCVVSPASDAVGFPTAHLVFGRGADKTRRECEDSLAAGSSAAPREGRQRRTRRNLRRCFWPAGVAQLLIPRDGRSQWRCGIFGEGRWAGNGACDMAETDDAEKRC